jgi:hypothetical protein
MICKVMLLVWISLCALLYSGCASNAAFMDACPSQQGESGVSVGVSYRGTLQDSAGVTQFTNVDASLVPVDITVSTASSDRLDVFIRYTAPLTLSLGLKSSFMPLVQGRVYYAAIGGSIGIDAVSLLSESLDNTIYFDFRLPFYQTLCFSDYFSFSLIPALWIRSDYRYFQFLAGGNSNIRIGKTFGAFFEASVFYNGRYKEPEYQGGVALFVKLRRNK